MNYISFMYKSTDLESTYKKFNNHIKKVLLKMSTAVENYK